MRPFYILNSVLAHHCQDNDTAEIRSGEKATIVPLSMYKPTQLQATEHFLLTMPLFSWVFKIGLKNYSVPKKKPGKTMILLTSLFLNNLIISGNRPYSARMVISGGLTLREMFYSDLVVGLTISLS